MRSRKYDVVVTGAGSAGIAAAMAASQAGARTLLIEAGPTLGGELLTGMTIDGAINARGEAIVGGVMDQILKASTDIGGFVARLCDWRLIRYIACDPELLKIAIAQCIYDAGIDVLLYTFAEECVMDGQQVKGVLVRNRAGQSFIEADAFVDASGDADLSALAGAPMLPAAETGNPQPVSMMFRMSGVETQTLLEFVRRHPENVAVGESDAIRDGRTDAQLVEEIYRQGQPSVFFRGDGPLLKGAIESGEMFPTALIMIQPTSEARQEVCINATRVSLSNPLDPDALGQAYRTLTDQVRMCSRFLSAQVPGFGHATLWGLAPRIGIRETRRIEGDEILTQQDVKAARKRDDGVAKGCHHIDIHQDGTGQIRIPVDHGGSYDIPLGTLLPKGLANVVVAGRCLSADRGAHGSARVMGSCMAMGQAAGTLAAMAADGAQDIDLRAIDVQRLRERLVKAGAILDGTA